MIHISDYTCAVPDRCKLDDVVKLLDAHAIRYDIKRSGEKCFYSVNDNLVSDIHMIKGLIHFFLKEINIFLPSLLFKLSVVKLLDAHAIRYDIKRSGEKWLDMGFPNRIPGERNDLELDIPCRM